MPKLLAKSLTASNHTDFGGLTLVGHLERGIIAAQTLGAIAPKVCKVLNLSITSDLLTKYVAMSIWLHDIGKANRDFQAMILAKSNQKLLAKHGIETIKQTGNRQTLRHEALSLALILILPQLQTWLNTGSEEINPSVLMGVFCHHYKAHLNKFCISDDLPVYLDSESIGDILQLGVKYFGLSDRLPELNLNVLTVRQLRKIQLEILEYAKDVEDAVAGDFEQQKIFMAVRWLVMGCDAAASSLLSYQRGDRSFCQWISDSMSQYLAEDEVNKVISDRLQGKPLRDFQLKAKSCRRRVVIVNGGCGSGKSLIPYLILHRRIVEENLQVKLFFYLPTMTTTTQMFINYSNSADALIHSANQVYEEILELNQGDPEDESDFQAKSDSLKQWCSKQVFCTAHNPLGLLQNYRSPVYAFPAYANGFFVFDEIHAYSPEMFGTLLSFLKLFKNAPIILMSASMTSAQKEAIAKTLAEVGETADFLEGPQELETLKRYRLTRVENWDYLWERAIAEYNSGGKVLWIVNTVAACQKIYAAAVKRGINNALIFHSRFRLEDKIRHQEELVKAFESSLPVFAVTTQVAEMSLDIEASLLISETAPFWDLIQRLGRLARWVALVGDKYELRMGRPGDALVYPAEQTLPYTKADLAMANQLLEMFPQDAVLSQKDLAEAIALIQDQKQLEPLRPSALNTFDMSFRSLITASYQTNVLLDADVRRKGFKFSDVKRHLVPASINDEKLFEYNPKFKTLVAPDSVYIYHPEIGAYKPKHKDVLGYDPNYAKYQPRF